MCVQGNFDNQGSCDETSLTFLKTFPAYVNRTTLKDKLETVWPCHRECKAQKKTKIHCIQTFTESHYLSPIRFDFAAEIIIQMIHFAFSFS